MAWNFALDRALEHAKQLGKPLVVLEALRCDYPYASDRLHGFVLDGMRDNAARLQSSAVHYHPYVEPGPGAAKGMLAAFADSSCLVVTDFFPSFFLPRMLASAAKALPVCLERVDSNGLLPLAAADKAYPTAYAFRRFLQKALPLHLSESPQSDPLRGKGLARLAALPGELGERWPATRLEARGEVLASLPIDHGVASVGPGGGAHEAGRRLDGFLEERLPRYGERSAPDVDASSGLSPYLHFGHISAHGIFAALAEREGWSPEKLGEKAAGKRAGWWGMGEAAESFLDQLVTWRELGYVTEANGGSSASYDALPQWAIDTLEKHAGDKREHCYTLEEFDQASTHDPLWNAAQNQLVTEGRIQNYLRMLWGKKILEWSPSPQEAMETMVALNDRYALDGRDPNSYTGISWCLGRYDRPWGPERPIFGRVRYMTSANTARKFKVGAYLDRYASRGLGLA